MDRRTLKDWNHRCASLKERIKGVPFPEAMVFVTKSANSAILIFLRELGLSDGVGVRCGIGHAKANYLQIAEEIFAVARQHDLIDTKTKLSAWPTPKGRRVPSA
jgi:hypothetical protein